MRRLTLSLLSLSFFFACNAAEPSNCVPVELKNADIAGGKTLPADSCYLVKTDLSLTDGTLTVEKGVQVLFAADRGLTLSGRGRLKVNGTAAAPVLFSGEDAVVRWRGLHLNGSQGADNLWAYFEIANAGSELWTGAPYSDAALFVDGSSGVVADHLTIRGSVSHGLLMFEKVTTTFTNLTLAGNATAAYVHPEVVDQLPADTLFEGNTKPWVRVVFGNNNAVTGTHTWPAFTYHIEDRFQVTGNLVIAAGATLAFAQDVGITVESGATLRAQGTAAANITFTRADTGLWKGIEVKAGTFGAPAATFEFCVFEHAASAQWSGAPESSAALYLQTSAAAKVTDTVFRNNAYYGIWAGANASLPGFERNTFSDNVRVMLLHPNRVGELGAGNTFSNNTLNGIHVVFGNNDQVSAPATWKNQGVPFFIRDRFSVKAALILDPGVVIQVAQDSGITVEVGGSLKAKGTATQKVTFEGQTADATGFWRGLKFDSNEPANVLTHTNILHAGSALWTGGPESAAAVYVSTNAQVTFSSVTIGPGGGYGVHLTTVTSMLTCSMVTFTSNVKGDVRNAATSTTLTGC